ncbi:MULTISPECIES: DEAD/DEAH box helicase [unclassified Halomonas]|uniref:DEAD-box ATP-dependent RNA helicase RhpA n=1 Tax=Halomonas sp. RT37 TaxID=2950872 RepID=A0AAU7KLA2_9GAMM|nr:MULTISPECIES: DEAD/DEAH box helicase [unclassified Halomonas]MBR9770439.1 DEAD/DEAH box helicase [Gammaproteobacteria bacterium]MBS8270451.1 ATP-dependent helicase [Halomonas litopenaei]MAR72338.1 RNA helicase [Halomonas sp.]MBR9879845.1 DEAD/DEAH box helicase [Gammaproteobacteria bacterium]MBY6108989.1 DEAD/DEAH box helicase [Halomonas sp. DP1Y21-3]|tara:strand:+ start:1257 stop:2993 length:1737 start_codon:yes stop_codon:yes gene_type:complete
MTSTTVASPSFGDLALLPAVLSAIETLGYETPSPIQAQTIPALLEGRDMLGQAQTGTGKTAAFALPILSRIELDRREPQVLVLAPTRELAQQVAVSFSKYGQNLKGLEVATLCGGQEYREQLSALRRGAQVVVGTPGRVIDHLDRGSLKLSGLNALVLDEADEMLRMGFIDDVKRVVADTPENAQRVFFSATLPTEIERIVNRYLVDPVKVAIEARTTTAESIEQRLVRVDGGAKLEALSRILEVEPVDAAIVFVRTRAACTTLMEQLSARGVNVASLSGDLDQSLRERTITRLKRAKVDVLIATDVAARGLDVPRITHVINYDLPQDAEAYTHRIGRTGRAGRNGVAITFAGFREGRKVGWLEQATGQKMAVMELPDEAAIRAHRDNVFHQRVIAAVTKGAEEQRALVERLVEEGYDPIELACAFSAMARADEAPIGRLQAPRKERNDRAPRDGKPQRRRESRGPSEGMTRYRVSVGHKDGVKPGQLVGALANEGGIEGARIGRIDIRNGFSTVELPNGLPASILAKMARARVAGRPLEISEDRGGDRAERGGERSGERAPRRRRDDEAPVRRQSRA